MVKLTKTGAKRPTPKAAKISQVKSKPIPAKTKVVVAKVPAKTQKSVRAPQKQAPIIKAIIKPKSQKTVAKPLPIKKPVPVQAKPKTSPIQKVVKSKSPLPSIPAKRPATSRSPVPTKKQAVPLKQQKPDKAQTRQPVPKPITKSLSPVPKNKAQSTKRSQTPAKVQKKPDTKVNDTKKNSVGKPATGKDNAKPVPVVKEETKMVKAVRKGKAAVDVECPKAKDCHVFEEANKVWTVTLNQADLKNNANKYYIIQLLQSDTSGNSYYVWNRWGRVGYAGQNALKGPFTDVNRAKADYESKLRDKTRGGYIEVQIVYEEETETKKEPTKSKSKPAKEVKSSLDNRVSNLMNLIFDLKSINRTLAEIGYDSKKMPLGKLSSVTIKQGMEVLKQIENALNSTKKADLQTLSSRFYSLIPHDFGFQQMSNFIINSSEKLKKKVEMLESLADMKIATNILESSSDGNPLDDHYKKLNCKLTPLDHSDPVFKLIVTYVKNTHGQSHSYYTLDVEEVFRVEKSGENEKFVKNIKNNMLLWHGSRLTNWVGILSQGLRIAPPEAPVSGYMFGKGVYFADMVSKSANYCFTDKTNNTGVMLLCDVAIGNFNEKIHSDYNAGNLPKGKQSTKGCGLMAPPEKSYKDLEGCKVPLGPGEKVTLNGGYLQYNEYIVYNTNQIKMKFLLKVKFNYKY